MEPAVNSTAARDNRLRWWENLSGRGVIQVAIFALWAIFLMGKYFLSEIARLPRLQDRAEPMVVFLTLGCLVFLGVLLARRSDVKAMKNVGMRHSTRRTLGVLLLLAVAVAFVTHSVVEFLVVVWVLLLAWALGRVVGWRAGIFGWSVGAAEFTVSVGIGLGLLISLVTVLGFAGWLYSGVLYGLLAALSLLLLKPILAILRPVWSPQDGPGGLINSEADTYQHICVALLAALVVLSSASALAPEVGYDALTYQLAAAKVFAKNHRIVEIPEMTPSYWPANGMVLYTLAHLLGGPKLAKLFHFGFGLLLVAAICGFGSRYLSKATGIRGGLIFLSVPLVLWEAGTAYSDLSMSFYCLLGIWLFLESFRGSRSVDLRTVSLSGFAFGIALGFKPFALIIMMSLAIAVFVRAVRKGTPPLRQSLMSILLLSGTSAIFSFHWYLRSYMYTGNPIFPWFNALFRSPYFSSSELLLNLPLYGMGTRPLDLVMLPWNITFYPGRFVEVGTLGVVFLLFLPLMPGARRLSDASPWFIFVLAIFLVFWVKTGQYARYLLPVLPLVAIFYAGAIVRWCREQLDSDSVRARVVHAILVAVVIEQAVLWFPWEDTRFPYRVVLGRESSSEYLARIVPSSNVWFYANQHLNEQAVVLSVGNEQTYYSNRRVVPWGWFSAVLAARSPECFDFRNEESTHKSLVLCGYTHVLVDRGSNMFRSNWIQHMVFGRDSFYSSVLQLEYAFGEVSLYKVRKV